MHDKSNNIMIIKELGFISSYFFVKLTRKKISLLFLRVLRVSVLFYTTHSEVISVVGACRCNSTSWLK